MLLLVLAVVFLRPVVLGGRALLPGQYLAAMHPWAEDSSPEQDIPQWNALQWDSIAQFYPWRVHYARAMHEGSVPLWNPHQFCGAPFAANAQSAVFYPPNMLFLLIAPVRALGLSAALHLFLVAAFTYLLARALGLGWFGSMVAGTTFAFSGFMVAWLELPSIVNVATWLPLIFYLILRSSDLGNSAYAVFAGLAIGVSILGGHFQIASYVVGAALLWWIWLIAARARAYGRETIPHGLLLAGLSLAVAFLIAAPQVLPTLELAGLSHRVRTISAEGYERYVSNAIPARNFITLFVPNFYGNPSTNSYWAGSAANYMEYAMYIGLPPLILAIVGAVFTIRWRSTGFFLALALLGFLLAFGAPVNLISYYLLPGTGSLGGPNRTIILFCFAAAMLAGFGAHWFADHAREDYAPTGRKLGWRALTVAAAIFATLFLAGQFIATAAITEFGIDAGEVIGAAFGQYISFVVILLAAFGVLGLYTGGFIPRPLFTGLILAATIGDLFSFGMGFNPTSSPEQVYGKTRLTDWLQRNARETRLMPINNSWSLFQHPDAVLPPNSATVYGFYDMQGYDSLFSRRYKEFVDERLQMDSSPRENGNMLFIRKYVEGWPKGTAGFVISQEELNRPGLAPVFDTDSLRVYRKASPGGDEAAYLVPLAEAKPGGAETADRTWVTGRSTNEVSVLVTDAAGPSRLVLAETHYPGWRADVDGVSQRITVEKGIFRAVTVEPGGHSVTFRFEPGTFVVGMFLGLLGATAVGVAAGSLAVRRRK
ncbi:MAG: hypothetical protein HYX78_13420 [Armatimonadetes bacterium]|nr:hypothetical protein [Armatimonadota bacterium]